MRVRSWTGAHFVERVLGLWQVISASCSCMAKSKANPPGGQTTTVFVLRPSPTLTVPHQTNARVSNLCEFLVPFVAAEAPSTFITRETRRQQWPKISVMETGRRVVCRRRVSVNRCVELNRVYIVVSGARGRRGRVEGGRLPTTLFRGRWISRDS